MKTIVIWGDSIGKGVIYNEERRRYCLAKDRCAVLLQAAGLNIENQARMGETIGEGYARFLDTMARPGDIAVIEYGGNDCDPDWDAVSADPAAFHDGKTPLPLFRETLSRFIAEARRRGLTPAAVVPPPLEAGRYFSWICRGRDAERIYRYLGDVQHIYRWQERYAAAVRDVARRTGARLIDLRDAFLEAGAIGDYYCVDGIHPNEKGHRLICKAIADQLALQEFAV